jgi:gas vesicle protein
MVKEPKRKVKKIVSEKEVVELTIELSAEFFDNMDKAKQEVAVQRGYDITYGEYMEEALNDLVKMVGQLSEEIQKMSMQQQQDIMSMIPEVKDNSKKEEKKEEVSEYDELMQEFIEVKKDEVMYG